MNRHFLEEALPLLGAKVIQPAPVLPEWKRIGVDLYAHRTTGMLKFTPPVPPKAEAPRAMPTVLGPFDWRDGFPEERERWYVCSNANVESYARYARADGRWSRRINRDNLPPDIDAVRDTFARPAYPLRYQTYRPSWLPD